MVNFEQAKMTFTHYSTGSTAKTYTESFGYMPQSEFLEVASGTATSDSFVALAVHAAEVLTAQTSDEYGTFNVTGSYAVTSSWEG